MKLSSHDIKKSHDASKVSGEVKSTSLVDVDERKDYSEDDNESGLVSQKRSDVRQRDLSSDDESDDLGRGCDVDDIDDEENYDRAIE